MCVFSTKFQCRKCWECRQQDATYWAIRNSYHEKTVGGGPIIFVTLTYREKENETIVLNRKHIKDFFKLFRYYVKTKITYFGCGEYGPTTNRAHYHAIIYGWTEPREKLYFNKRKKKWMYHYPTISKSWKHGFTEGSPIDTSVDNATAYSALYAQKHPNYSLPHVRDNPPFRFSSKGIGSEGMMQSTDENGQFYHDGKIMRLPAYYLNKKYDYEALKKRKIKFGRHVTEVPAEDEQEHYLRHKDLFHLRAYRRYLDAGKDELMRSRLLEYKNKRSKKFDNTKDYLHINNQSE